MDNTLLVLAAFAAIIAAAVAMAIIAVRRDGRGMGDLLKQLVIWVGIVALLPLTGMAGAALLHPKTQLTDLTAQQKQVQWGMNSSGTRDDPAERAKVNAEFERLRKLIEAEQRLYNRAMFRVGFPIGLAALVLGLFLPSVTVGTSLALGGLSTLAVGCYSYWDDMGDAVRFFSLLAVLVILTAIGLLKFRRPAPVFGEGSGPVLTPPQPKM